MFYSLREIVVAFGDILLMSCKEKTSGSDHIFLKLWKNHFKRPEMEVHILIRANIVEQITCKRNDVTNHMSQCHHGF